MNAVEIEQAVSNLAEIPFDPAEFPYAFLEAFGNKETTLKRLRSGNTNQSDLTGGVLQRNNIHIKVCTEGEVTATLNALRESPATARQKAKYILATDGKTLESERLIDGVTLACEYSRFPDRFTFFLPLAGISTVEQIDESAFDIRATSRLNRLYVELLKTNPDWDTDARRGEMNHFFARLIFCFFAEDTNIFRAPTLFTATVEQFSAKDSSNTHEVISEIFRAMQVKSNEKDRKEAKLAGWANQFPYVNGGLFSGSLDVPRFSKIARSYLLHVGNLDWTKINPDIFGSMIQAVADDEERGALGMHYTSVPNILKVLNPLFLDDLREKLAEAGDNSRKLLNLRNRMARIRVFDPACGSGNFLVIAYKEMRAIEAEINKRRGEVDRRSDIPLTNFRGIEIRHFSCEIARLALIIAEYQCDVLYRGEKLALAEFLPLEADNWITCGNALRLDWLSICPPTGEEVKHRADDLFSQPVEQAEVEFENEGGETYICGNPPYVGNKLQTTLQKDDLKATFDGIVDNWRSLDYVCGWLMKAVVYGEKHKSAAAFVATNSICQGQQVPILWPIVLSSGHSIAFAHTSFKWNNLASNNAGVTVVIVGLAQNIEGRKKRLYTVSDAGETVVLECGNITPYLTSGQNLIVEGQPRPINGMSQMMFGNMPRDGGHLLMAPEEKYAAIAADCNVGKFLKNFVGSEDAIYGKRRICIWTSSAEYREASQSSFLQDRFHLVRRERQGMKAASTQSYADKPYRFVQIQGVAVNHSFLIPRHSSESRNYLPVAIFDRDTIVADSAFAIYDSGLFDFSILVSRIHLVWIATVCGKLETRYRYSNTLGWNNFPVPVLTEHNRADLTRCAEEILLAREAHFPATIADLYDPEKMPIDLREAHDRNDETLERIYIGRRFKNDTERLEKLFGMYTQMTAKQAVQKGTKRTTESNGKRAKS